MFLFGHSIDCRFMIENCRFTWKLEIVWFFRLTKAESPAIVRPLLNCKGAVPSY